MHPLAARLVRAGLLTAVVDGLFSSVLSVVFYHSTAARVFQGVASTLMGPSAINGGTGATLLGLVMHCSVAFTWSTVFLGLVRQFAPIRRTVASPFGPLKIAALYGPSIWMVMSLAVIPFLLNRPPTINIRWWVQFFGHIPFVAVPIISMIGTGGAKRAD
jgi:hypothetical protein